MGSIESICSVAEIVDELVYDYDVALRDMSAGDEILDEQATG